MILSADTPAARARRSSPSETTSMPAPSLRERAQHGLIGIRFDGETDQRVLACEGVGQHMVVPLQRGGRIAIERRADLGRDAREADVFRMKDAVFVGEMMHGGRSEDRAWPQDRRGPAPAFICSNPSSTKGLCSLARRLPVYPDQNRPSPVARLPAWGVSSEPRTPQPASDNARTRASQQLLA